MGEKKINVRDFADGPGKAATVTAGSVSKAAVTVATKSKEVVG